MALSYVSVQSLEIDMEEEFLNIGLDIIGLGVFNYDFGSITQESPVIKVNTTVRPSITCSECPLLLIC